MRILVCSRWRGWAAADASALCVRLCGADVSMPTHVIQQPSAHDLDVNSVGFSPDGTKIVSGSLGGSIKLWGERAIAFECAPFAAWCGPECGGGRPLTCMCARARHADALTLALLAEQALAHSFLLYCVCFSPDGTRVVSVGLDNRWMESGSSDSSIRLWGGIALSLACGMWMRVLCCVCDRQQ
jgi:WD40 repeat protein